MPMRPIGRALRHCCDCGEPIIGWHWGQHRVCSACLYARNRREAVVVAFLGTLAAALLAFCALARGLGL